MYTPVAINRIAAERKQLSQEQLVDLFSNSDKLLKDLGRINPFVIDRFKPQQADMNNIFRTILKANGLNVLGRVMSSGDRSYGNILAVSNAYVDKYLAKLEETNKIKRLLNPLNPDSYKSTAPKQYTLENLDYAAPTKKGTGQALSAYLKEQDRTTAVMGESLRDMLTTAKPSDYIPNLMGYVLKYNSLSPKRVKWLLDTLMRPSFTAGTTQGKDIDNDLFDTPLVSLLRKHGITGSYKRKNLSLYNIMMSSLDDYLEQAYSGEISLDEAMKNPADKAQIIRDLAQPTNQLKFISDLVTTNEAYKREAGKYEGRGSKSVSTMQESALGGGEGEEGNNVQDIAELIMSQHNVEQHTQNAPTQEEQSMMAGDPAYDAAYKEVLGTIMNNYVLALLPKVAAEVITASNMKEDLKFKQVELGIEQLVADKYAGSVTAALQSAFSPDNIRNFYDPGQIEVSGRSTIANEMFSLIDAIIEDAAVKANLNPKIFSDEFKEGLSQKIAARLMATAKPKIEASLRQNFDKIVSELVARTAPIQAEQGGKFDNNTAKLLLNEVLEYLDQFTVF